MQSNIKHIRKSKSNCIPRPVDNSGDSVTISLIASICEELSSVEQKTFMLALHKAWMTSSNLICMKKDVLADLVGDNSEYLYQKIKKLPIHSYFHFSDTKRDIYISGVAVSSISVSGNAVRVKFCEDVLPLLQKLVIYGKECTGFCTVLGDLWNK